jgi:hypothetical protein
MLAGFSIHPRSGNWLGSPLYLGLARSLINKMEHRRYTGRRQNLRHLHESPWDEPGFQKEGGLCVAVNPPDDESDLDVFEFSPEVKTPRKEKAAQPLSMTLFAILLLFLFLETFWTSRRDRV